MHQFSIKPNRNKIDVPPLDLAIFNVDGTPVASFVTDGTDEGNVIFDQQITAFGADFAAIADSPNNQNTLIEVLGNDIQIPTVSGNQVRFFGFVADTSFTQLTFKSPDSADGWSMDNVVTNVITDPTQVPEPSSAIGFLTIGIVTSALTLKHKLKN